MIPRGREDEALRFYTVHLGLSRIPKPADMPNPDGIWLALGQNELHLGVDEGMPDATTRAHVALELDDLDAAVDRLRAAGVETRAANAISGLRRVHVRDPFGNRLELMGL
jgi:catechol 2,3-dioxygenase-like lactoylglutathione lyase family enzyme